MKFINLEIDGLIIIEPDVHEDSRGYFYESYSKDEFYRNGIKNLFVQDNQSLSQKNVLRGLHFQKPPHSQAKLIRVLQGSVLDIAVDLRKESKTYGKYYATKLSASNKRMFYVPDGFAHGFLTLEDNTIFSYKCSNYYNKDSEDSLLWNDENLDINWGVDNPVLSDKDKQAKSFSQYVTPF